MQLRQLPKIVKYKEGKGGENGLKEVKKHNLTKKFRVK